jgi:hypothetical protein
MQMLVTAGQSSQASMFNLRYDFPTEWSAIVNVPGNSFNVTTEPGGSVRPVTPNVDLVALSNNVITNQRL